MTTQRPSLWQRLTARSHALPPVEMPEMRAREAAHDGLMSQFDRLGQTITEFERDLEERLGALRK